MKKQMRKAVYEAPFTERFQVELEGVFCGSVEINDQNNTKGPSISSQEVEFSISFESGSWE